MILLVQNHRGNQLYTLEFENPVFCRLGPTGCGKVPLSFSKVKFFHFGLEGP
jgi:hypothetical protein